MKALDPALVAVPLHKLVQESRRFLPESGIATPIQKMKMGKTISTQVIPG